MLRPPEVFIPCQFKIGVAKSGCVAVPLWWAHKYGNYKHEDLQVSEGISESL